jgi:hypothetical protein
MTTVTEVLNDRFQQSPDPAAGAAVLAGCTVRQLRALADLNYTDDEAGRAGLIAGLMDARFGGTA